MVKRKKRLEKGIISLENQKKLHELKRKQAEKLGQEELFKYYTKEIKSLEERKRNREGKLKRSILKLIKILIISYLLYN